MKISVLIPAFRATYLGQAIASVLAQGFEGYELLINDDSLGDDVRAVVERFKDPRIGYSRTAGATGAAENIRQLWGAARTDRLKFLFDDDILLPHALVHLSDQLDAHPAASFVFGHRDLIDEVGRIRSAPRVISENKVVQMSRVQLSSTMIPRAWNRVGEYSNLLMNRASGITLDDMNAYCGFEVEMLVDVAFHLNAAARGPAVGVGLTVTQYRKHANQNSSFGFNPFFYKGLFEWELFLRGEYAQGHLDAAQALAGVEKLTKAFGAWAGKVPELAILRPGLAELGAKVEAGDRDVLDSSFRQRWDDASNAAKARAASQKSRLEELRDAGAL